MNTSYRLKWYGWIVWHSKTRSPNITSFERSYQWVHVY